MKLVMNRLGRLMAQGMRCGHIDGKARCGIYIIGEEEMQSLDAAQAQGLTDRQELLAWSNGYEAGYRWGAEGTPLAKDIVSAPLP